MKRHSNNRRLVVLLNLLVLSVSYMWAQSNFVGPPSEELIQEISLRDSMLFMRIFEQCDIESLKDHVTEDIEFYHDKWGMIANSRAQLTTNLEEACSRQKAGIDNKGRRKLLQASVKVYPISDYGAIQEGKHLFYQLKAGVYEFTESARFTHLWKKTDTGWQISRILSFDHKPAP